MKIKRFLIFLLVIIFLSVLAVYYPHLTGNSISNSNQEYEKESCSVNRVIDGDTLICDNKTIRLLGINTTMLEFIRFEGK